MDVKYTEIIDELFMERAAPIVMDERSSCGLRELETAWRIRVPVFQFGQYC